MSDQLLAPIYSSSTSVTLYIDEGGGVADTLTIAAGDYYGHASYYGLGNPLSGFFYELATALGSSPFLAGTYSIQAGTPRKSPMAEGLGLVIEADVDFTIDFGASTMPPEWLGMDYQESGAISSTGGIWRSDYCRWGTWTSKRGSMMRDREPLRLLTASTVQGTHANRHLTDLGTRHLRALSWNMIPAAWALKYKADDADYADAAKRGVGDTLGAYEWIHESGQNGDALLVCHGGLDGLALSTSEWEQGYMYEAGQIESIRNSLRRMNTGGEYYQVDLFLELVPDVGSYFDRARS